MPHTNHLIFNKPSKNKQWGKEFLFNKWSWDNWLAICRRLKLDLFLIPYIKINSRWIKHLNVKPKAIKTLEDNLDNIILDRNGQRFHDEDAKSNCNKIKNWQIGYNYTRELLHSKQITRVNRKSTEWKKFFCKVCTWQRYNIQHL